LKGALQNEMIEVLKWRIFWKRRITPQSI